MWNAIVLPRRQNSVIYPQSAISQQIRALEYLRCYSGQELHQAVAEFSQLYPEVSISIVNGTHEELYDLLRFGGVDVILSDQRRAFSSQYENYQLLQCGCYAELSVRSHLSSQESVELESLKRIPCILISSREQQNTEQDYFQNTLGFGGNFLFAENLEEGRLMVAGNRAFSPLRVWEHCRRQEPLSGDCPLSGTGGSFRETTACSG